MPAVIYSSSEFYYIGPRCHFALEITGLKGAMTINITALSIMTFSIMTYGIVTLGRVIKEGTLD